MAYDKARYITKIGPEGGKDGFGEPLESGYYFHGEDDGATMFGPYDSKDAAIKAQCKYFRILERKSLTLTLKTEELLQLETDDQLITITAQPSTSTRTKVTIKANSNVRIYRTKT